MKQTVKKNIAIFLLLLVEIYLLYTNRDELINRIPFLSLASQNNYDDVYVSIIGSVAFLVLQAGNCGLYYFISANVPHMVMIAAQYIFRYDPKTLKKKITQMIEFVFSARCKWGVTKETGVLKIANTAEGLIACADVLDAGISLSEKEQNEIKKALHYLINQLKTDGFESFNENVCTVHCTGMALYSIKRYINLEYLELRREDEIKIRDCLFRMLDNANEHGWGFINQKYDDTAYNRTLSTIWVLRALNVWGMSDNREFKQILRNLVEHTEGRLGFSIGSAPKYAATAMLHILIGELNNGKLKAELNSKFCGRKVAAYLLEGLQYEVEVEEFLTSVETARKLPWTHLTECLILRAITLFWDELNVFQSLKISRYIKNAVLKIDPREHYYVVEAMNFRYSEPFLYPTTYLISALCSIHSILTGRNKQ